MLKCNAVGVDPMGVSTSPIKVIGSAFFMRLMIFIKRMFDSENFESIEERVWVQDHLLETVFAC